MLEETAVVTGPAGKLRAGGDHRRDPAGCGVAACARVGPQPPWYPDAGRGTDPGVNVNSLYDDSLDPLSGTSVLNGVPVQVAPGSASASADGRG